MEILSARPIRIRKFGARSILTEFMLLTVVLVSAVLFLSQVTTHEAASRYGILKASYWDSIPYEMVPINEDGQRTEVGADDWKGDRRLVYEKDRSSPGFADFTFAHKLKGGFYLFVQYASPYLYTILLCGGGLFLFYRRRIRQPLQAMIEAANRVANGDLDFRVGIRSRDEFGRISEAFEQMRAALEQNSRESWRIAEERKRLNAAFSHDLRTPLSVLKGRIDLLADFYPSGNLDREETVSAISALRRNADRLERYVTSMTSVQKLDDLQPQRREVELTELVEEMHDIATSLSGAKTITTNEILTGALILDSGILFRVFENLIANAERFAAECIQITFHATPDSFAFIVTDDGPGFTPEALERATDPYYRGSDKEADTHFGLGLYLCRLLCEKHGGALSVGNAPSGGAEVTARFGSYA